MVDISEIEQDISDNDDRSENSTTDIPCLLGMVAGSMQLSGKGVLRRFGWATIAIVARVCDDL